MATSPNHGLCRYCRPGEREPVIGLLGGVYYDCCRHCFSDVEAAQREDADDRQRELDRERWEREDTRQRK